MGQRVDIAPWVGVQEGEIQAEVPVGCRPRGRHELRMLPGHKEACRGRPWVRQRPSVRLDEQAKGPDPPYSQCCRTSAGPSSSGISLDMQSLGSFLDLLNHNLHFNKLPGHS